MIGIYKITNQVNGKVYIGQSIHIKVRWQQHCQQSISGTTYLYQAMRKYGIKNFSFDVVEECLPEQLNEREVYWIAYYDSFNKEKGYNMTPGGTEPIYANAQKIYELWDSGLSVGEIAEELSDEISYCTVRNHLYDYKNWSIEESKKRGAQVGALKRSNYQRKNNTNVIKQYSLFGDFIANWRNITEIQKILNIPHNSINNVINGKYLQAGGFQWRKGDPEDVDTIENIVNKVPSHFEVIQKDLNGNFINRYKTLKEAGAAVKTDPVNIARVCKKQGNRKTARGFIWEYDYNTWYDPD